MFNTITHLFILFSTILNTYSKIEGEIILNKINKFNQIQTHVHEDFWTVEKFINVMEMNFVKNQDLEQDLVIKLIQSLKKNHFYDFIDIVN